MVSENMYYYKSPFARERAHARAHTQVIAGLEQVLGMGLRAVQGKKEATVLDDIYRCCFYVVGTVLMLSAIQVALWATWWLFLVSLSFCGVLQKPRYCLWPPQVPSPRTLPPGLPTFCEFLYCTKVSPTFPEISTTQKGCSTIAATLEIL